MNIIPQITLSNYEGTRSYDLYSLLLKERIIFIDSTINDETASLVIAEIIYLNAQSSDEKIIIYINSPGGSVTAGLAIYDCIKNSKAIIETRGIGMCASMGAFLLASGHKGYRKAYPNCEIMIHQPLGSTDGQVSDLEIMTKQFLYLKSRLNKILQETTSQPLEKIQKDTDRNFFMNAEEALTYHIIDEIIN